jgi:hypothetical protein
VVAEKVAVSWQGKILQRWKNECDRTRKENLRRKEQGLDPLSPPTKPAAKSDEPPQEVREPSAGTPAENPLKRRDREGIEIEKGESRSAAAPSGDLSAIVFEQGVAWLKTATKKPDGACRALLGKWRKAFGADEALIAAIGTAQRLGPIEPVAWMEGAIRARNANGAAKTKTWDEHLP